MDVDEGDGVGQPDIQERSGRYTIGSSTTGGWRGLGAENDVLNTAELFDPRTGTFQPTGPMQWRRESHTATLLADGRVLIAGGGIAQAELYDPATRTFSTAGSLVGENDYATATLLRDGRVLLAASSRSVDADLYDPATGSFTPTDQMAGYCAGKAVLLPDGRVLFVGCGEPDGMDSPTAQLYDPATGKFSFTGSMKQPRTDPAVTLLADGRVLVSGGSREVLSLLDYYPESLASAELFDPASATFRDAGQMVWSRVGHTAALLCDGTVLVAGGDGRSGDALAKAELFDPARGAFASTRSSLIGARSGGTATLLSDGRVLLVGGEGPLAAGSPQLSSAEIYAPASTASDSLKSPTLRPTCTS